MYAGRRGGGFVRSAPCDQRVAMGAGALRALSRRVDSHASDQHVADLRRGDRGGDRGFFLRPCVPGHGGRPARRPLAPPECGGHELSSVQSLASHRSAAGRRDALRLWQLLVLFLQRHFVSAADLGAGTPAGSSASVGARADGVPARRGIPLRPARPRRADPPGHRRSGEPVRLSLSEHHADDRPLTLHRRCARPRRADGRHRRRSAGRLPGSLVAHAVAPLDRVDHSHFAGHLRRQSGRSRLRSLPNGHDFGALRLRRGDGGLRGAVQYIDPAARPRCHARPRAEHVYVCLLRLSAVRQPDRGVDR